MTDARATDDRAPRAAQQRTPGGRRGMLFAGETEARPGILTSEFLLTLLAATILVVAGYASDAFDERLGWTLFAGVVAAYILSRGIAKAGSKEGPFIVQPGDAKQNGSGARTRSPGRTTDWRNSPASRQVRTWYGNDIGPGQSRSAGVNLRCHDVARATWLATRTSRGA